jgi:hypothetical protein
VGDEIKQVVEETIAITGTNPPPPPLVLRNVLPADSDEAIIYEPANQNVEDNCLGDWTVAQGMS